MPPHLLRPLALLGAALAVLLALAPTAHARWRRPVRGAVVARYAYDRAAPFARGQRRGVGLAAAPGEAVLAPCGGRVSYAGRVPGREGQGVSVRCGSLTATLLGLGRLDARRGELVLPGESVGTAGATGSVHLGARVSADRFGYRDPLALLGPAPGPEPPALPVRRVPRAGPPAPSAPSLPPAPLPAPRPLPMPRPVAAAPRRAPLTAWLGVALLAVVLPAGGAVSVVRRRARAGARRSADAASTAGGQRA